MKKILALGPFALLLAACGGGGGMDTNGTLKLGVTDAPVDEADEIIVTFSAVELLDGGDTVRERFAITPPLALDLLEFQGDSQRFLVGTPIDGVVLPAGDYPQVRLIVEGSGNSSCNSAIAQGAAYPNYVIINGQSYPLLVPSGAQSGLKVQGPITITAGGNAAYTVDFDLRKSVSQRGSTGCYNLRPVLRVVDNAQAGTLRGKVSAALLADSGCTADPVTGAGAAVYVYTGAGVTPDDFDGTAPHPLSTGLLAPLNAGGVVSEFIYEIGFLPAGSYTAAFTCQAGGDVPPDADDPAVESDNPLVFVQPQTAVIRAGQDTLLDFTVAPPVEAAAAAE